MGDLISNGLPLGLELLRVDGRAGLEQHRKHARDLEVKHVQVVFDRHLHSEWGARRVIVCFPVEVYSKLSDH